MKKKLLGSMVLGLSIVLGCAAPAMADSRKVVTLGADLTDEQKNTMMRYFGVDYNGVDVLYINNTDEREHLGSYVPLEQIGNYTYSCALVAPTSSGGIQVKTANLEWVTCNMIASTLSTSGVTNCQVVAASPFKVSGTGALTGVIMAYEDASKVTLDPQKVKLANQELVTTGNLANNVGQSKATAVINETKIQVIENNVTDITEITNIVNNISNNYDVDITPDQSEAIALLMQQIAQQEYDITQLKATLDRVQANVVGDAGASEEEQQAAQEKAEASEQAALEAAKEEETEVEDENAVIFDDGLTEESENILENTDPSALEELGSTVDEADTTQTVQEQSEVQESEEFGIPEASDDGTIVIDDNETVTDPAEAPVETEAPADDTGIELIPGDGSVTEPAETEAPADDAGIELIPGDGSVTDPAAEETPETAPTITSDMLMEEDRIVYDEVSSDMQMTFGGAVVTADDGTQVYLTQEAATELPKKVEQYMLKVMTQGADALAAQEAADPMISQTIMQDTAAQAPDKNYENAQLKQIDKYVRRLVFDDAEEFLADSQLVDTDEVIIYDKLMGILESAYKVETEEVTDDAAMGGEVTDGSSVVDELTMDGVIDDTGAVAEGVIDDAGAAAEDMMDEFAGFEEEVGTF